MNFFITRKLPSGLIKIEALRQPLVVTAQQLAEIEATISEPDKEDPDKDALANYNKRGKK